MIGKIFYLVSFTQHNVFKVHLCHGELSALCSFSWLNNIPLCGHVMFYVSVHLLMRI